MHPMMQPIQQMHLTDESGNPAGGSTYGRGISIEWQNGPLKAANGELLEPNGAFVEGVLQAAKGRLEHYQESKFACPENLMAINAIKHALTVLEHRTSDRVARGVEGTHEV